MKEETLEAAEQIALLAEDKLAENVLIMDMRKVSGICDFFVIADASSAVRAKTIAEHIELEMKKNDERVIRRDGFKEGTWIVLDFSTIVVHVFRSDIRKFYNIEQLWGDAPRVIRSKRL